MTTWHWVRHGPTHEKRFVGWRNVPADLSDLETIGRLKAFLPAVGLMIASDLIRASATADAVSGQGHRRLPNDPGLREMHFGVWDGMDFGKVSDRDPEISRSFWERPGDVSAPQGESWNMTAARVNAVVDRLNALHPDAHIVAVAHIGVILTQLQRALDIPPEAVLSHTIDNLSVTRLHWNGCHCTADIINHLP
jgi:broad specificity phosphatase PhoE